MFDTNLKYTRVIGFQISACETDIDRILAHELAPVPTSMFSEPCDMKICTAKSVHKKVLQLTVSTRHLETQISCNVINGSKVLYVIHLPVNGMLQDYVTSFKYSISKILKGRDVILVFDRFRWYSTKSMARSGRTTQASRVHQLSISMPLRPQKVVLSVTKNKQQLIKMICDELIKDEVFNKEHTSSHRLIATGDDDTPVEIHKAVVLKGLTFKSHMRRQTIFLLNKCLWQQMSIRREFQLFLMILMYLFYCYTIPGSKSQTSSCNGVSCERANCGRYS